MTTHTIDHDGVTLTINGTDPSDVSIDTRSFLEKHAPVHDRAERAVAAFLARREARRVASDDMVWYSSESPVDTCADYLVRLLNRFERIEAIRDGGDPDKAQRWASESLGATINAESDMAHGFSITMIGHADGRDMMYRAETFALFADCEYFYQGEPTARELDVESGILDWCVGWYAEFLDGSECGDLSEKLGIGYSPNPTREIESCVVGRRFRPILRRVVRETARGVDVSWRARSIKHGRTIVLRPYVY